jgi:hypothetical protein
MIKNYFNLRFNKSIFIIAIYALLCTNNIFAIQKLDQIVAIVNDEVISQHELEMRVNDFRFLYLGFYIADCSHMNYKANYLPHQRLIDGQWITFER